MKVQAYKCEFCNFLFLKREEYKKHHTECKVEFEEGQRQKKLAQEIGTLADIVRLELTDIRDLGQATNEFFKKYYKTTLDCEVYNLRFKDGMLRDSRTQKGKFPNTGWHARIKFRSVKITHPLNPGWPKSGSDLFRGDWGFMSGINTDSGGGGDFLSYDCDIYLDDFPKLVAKYEEYLPLKIAMDKREKEVTRLKKMAWEQLIDGNEKMKKFKTHRQVLNKLLSNNEEMMKKLEDDITHGGEYKDALKPSADFEYDLNRLMELQPEFVLR